MTCAPSKDTDQPGHSPNLIRVFTVRMKKPWVLGYAFSWFYRAQAQFIIRLVQVTLKLTTMTKLLKTKLTVYNCAHRVINLHTSAYQDKPKQRH